MIKKTPVKIDKEMLNKALEKAKKMNIALTGTKLVNFMLIQVVNGMHEPEFKPSKFDWTEQHTTTMYWEEEYLLQFASSMQVRGLRHDYSFLFNLLVWSFLNEY